MALVVSEGDSESMALVPLEDVDDGVHTSGSHELSHEALELVESILQETRKVYMELGENFIIK